MGMLTLPSGRMIDVSKIAAADYYTVQNGGYHPYLASRKTVKVDAQRSCIVLLIPAWDSDNPVKYFDDDADALREALR